MSQLTASGQSAATDESQTIDTTGVTIDDQHEFDDEGLLHEPTVALFLRVPASLKEKLKRRARLDGRNLNALATVVLDRYIKRQEAYGARRRKQPQR